MNQPKFFATKSGDVLAALICGNGSLSCGGQAMEYLNANTSDGASEKHVPVVEMPVDENPVTEFAVARDDSPICVYAWCNLHGLWKTEL